MGAAFYSPLTSTARASISLGDRAPLLRAMARSIHDTLSIPMDAHDEFDGRLMSALGQKRTLATTRAMSALHPKADIAGRVRDVR
jgi:hypothetical protein